MRRLRAREKRVKGFVITTLAPSEAAQFTPAWNTLQGRFVDNPNGVVVQADHLVYDLMQKRGYPMGDFERLIVHVGYGGRLPLALGYRVERIRR